jgi:hypothetical protein
MPERARRVDEAAIACQVLVVMWSRTLSTTTKPLCIPQCRGRVFADEVRS